VHGDNGTTRDYAVAATIAPTGPYDVEFGLTLAAPADRIFQTVVAGTIDGLTMDAYGTTCGVSTQAFGAIVSFFSTSMTYAFQLTVPLEAAKLYRVRMHYDPSVLSVRCSIESDFAGGSSGGITEVLPSNSATTGYFGFDVAQGGAIQYYAIYGYK